MNTVLMDLKKLQELDDQRKLDQKALEESEAQLGAAAAKLKNFEDRLRAAESDRAAMEARHRELEAEVADLSVKRKNNETRQMSVKNNNEYGALLKEYEFLSQKISQTEDEILELLDRLEKRELEIGDLKILVTEEGEAYARVAAATEKACREGRERLARVTGQRAGVVENLPPDLRRQYDELIKARAGRAVSPASGGLCLACRLEFPPQVFNELQRNEKIQYCPNCGRIIYWQDHPDFLAPEAPPSDPV